MFSCFKNDISIFISLERIFVVTAGYLKWCCLCCVCFLALKGIKLEPCYTDESRFESKFGSGGKGFKINHIELASWSEKVHSYDNIARLKVCCLFERNVKI